jgi:CheY-like chemotaxis protein
MSASVHELGVGWVTIGRGDGNTFQILEGSISGRHCEVRAQGAELLVRDLVSTNGTFIGGQRISEGVVKGGQTLRLGDVELRFEAAGGQAWSGTSLMGQTPVTRSTILPPVEKGETVMVENKTGTAAASEKERRFQVLFVDDSMAFLELFSELCVEYSRQTWKIHKATSADAALALLKDGVMDLVLLDVGMPMLDGLQLLGLINRRHPGLKIAMMTGIATEARRADALANGAELFLEKPVTADGMRSVFNMLQDVIMWSRDGFTGALRQVNLQEVIQVECNGRHSSILEIRNPEMQGQIYIDAGAVTHAVVGSLTGRPAFYKLLGLRGGDFQMKAFKAPPQQTIDTGWEYLLMDAALAIDEESLATQKTPAEKAGQEPGREPLAVSETGDQTQR